MASSIQLLRSTNPQERPFAGNLLEGQPAANLHSSEPGLFFKTTDGSIVKFGPAAITSDGSPPNSTPQGSTGNSIGELWLDKSVAPAVLKVYDGAQWVDAGSGSGGGSGSFLRWIYTATGGETSLSGSSGGILLEYTAGLEEVYVNGVLITRGTDYSATSGTSITNLSPLVAGDVVTVLSLNPINTVQLPGQVSLLRWSVLATAGQITLSGADASSNSLEYTPGFEELYVNGSFLRRGVDYTATDGATITLASALTLNDEVTVLAWSPFTVADFVPSNLVTFTQTGSTAVSRTVESRLRETVSVDDFGAAGNGATDDRAAIQAALDSGAKNIHFTNGKTYAVGGTLTAKSNSVIYGNSATIKAIGTAASWTGSYSPGVRPVMGFSGTSKCVVRDLTIDGNASSFGPLIPDSYDGVAGFYVYVGCSDILVENCTCVNVGNQGFICNSNGVVGGGISKRVTFRDCLADTCGVGYGTEILFAGTREPVNNSYGGSPSDTTFDNCRSIGCNFGIYFAGSDRTKVIGGYYEAVRNQAFYAYIGDAYGVGSISFEGTTFFSNTAANILGDIQPICIQPVNTLDYLKASYLRVSFSGCTFNGTTASYISTHPGAWTTFEGCVFKETYVRQEANDPLATNVTTFPLVISDCLFEDYETQHALSLGKFSFSVSGTTFAPNKGASSRDGIYSALPSGEIGVVSNCVFGTDSPNNRLRHGITPIGVQKLTCFGNKFNGSGVFIDVSTEDSPLISSQGNLNGSFESYALRAAAGAPTTGTWAAGTIITNSAPTPGGNAGWICVTSGTPGTWKTFGTIAT